MVSRAVVIGVGEYALLEGYASIGASASAYAAIIGRDPWWSVHGSVEVLTPAQTADQAAVLDAVERAAHEADGPDDRLLVVYLGHGTFWTDQNAGEVHLAAAGSRPDQPYTWISQNALYRAMRRSRANLKVLVADACHSNKLSALESGRAGVTPGQRATCVISAAGDEQPYAWSQPCPELAADEELAGCTPFSGHLLRLVRDGSATVRDELPLPTLHHLLRTEMDACPAGHSALPEIMSTGWTFTATLFANRRFGLPPAQPAPEDATALGILRGGHDTLSQLADQPAEAADAIIDVIRRYGTSAAEGPVTNAQDVLLETLYERPDGLATYLATLHQRRERDPQIPRLVLRLIRNAHEYLAHLAPELFTAMIAAMRAAGHEGMALEVLRDYGRHSEPARLVDLTRTFHLSDRSFVLTSAALGGSVDDAAAVVARIFDPERGTMRDAVGWHIAIQVSDQRLVPDVARFIHRIRRLGNDELADWMLVLFGRARSDRPAYDKAMLYFALRHHGLDEDAEKLLGMTLESPSADRGPARDDDQPSAASHDPTRDLLAAFQHLSPEPVVERWFETRLTDPRTSWPERSRIARLAAGLLLAYPESNEHLLAHIARYADARCLVVICAELARSDRWRLVAQLRDRAAERNDETFLVDLLRRWAADPDLTNRLDGLIGIVVAGPAGAARPAEFLVEIADALDQEAAGRTLRQRFRHAAATRVVGRSGDELVMVLRNISVRQRRQQAERTLGRLLARSLVDGSHTPQRLAECLCTLADARLGLAVNSTCRELSDPTDDPVPATPLIETALAMCRRPHMHKTAWYLLERYLENEELVTPDDLVTGVTLLLSDGIVLDAAGQEGIGIDTRLLLRATVGRWDTRRRDDAVAALRAAGFEHPAEWVLTPLR